MKTTADLMIVDDNFRARQALVAYLSQQEGIRIAAQASDGLQAIGLIAAQTPDLILLDVEMPAMDGIEATRLIKQRWPWIKVIVLTLYPNHKARALAAGADAFLVKGGPLDEMMSAIRRLAARGAGQLHLRADRSRSGPGAAGNPSPQFA